MKAANWFRRFARWVPEVIVWLGQLPIFGFLVFAPINVLVVFVVGLTILLLALFAETCLEEEMRLGGLILQLFGFLTVVLKLVAAKGQFQLPTNSIRQWLERFPKFPPYHHVLGPEPGTLKMESGLAPRMRVAFGPTTPLDQKVARLEQQYAELFDEVGRLDQEVKKNAQEILEAVRAEIAERQKAEKRTQRAFRGSSCRAS